MIFILLIVTMIFSSCSKKTPSKEWEIFLDGLLEKYDFVDRYTISSGNRRSVDINLYLNRKKTANDLKKVFKEIKLFLDDEENVNTLNEYHKSMASVNSSGFDNIFVFFTYKDNNKEKQKGSVLFYSDAYSRTQLYPKIDLDNITFDDWGIQYDGKFYKYDSPELDDLP